MRGGPVDERAAVCEDPTSGVAWKLDERSWSELIRYVERAARVACIGVPEHVRADVESAAMVGLMEAAREFDSITAPEFRSYLNERVQVAVLSELEHFAPISHRAPQVDGARERAPSSLRGRDIEELPPESSVDEPWTDAELGELMVPLSDEALTGEPVTAEDAFIGSYSAAALRWGLAQLDQRDRTVLRLSYKRGQPLAAIARRLRVSTPRAYQIRVEAERRLARLLRRSPTLARMKDARAHCDWDDNTEETTRRHSLRKHSVNVRAAVAGNDWEIGDVTSESSPDTCNK